MVQYYTSSDVKHLANNCHIYSQSDEIQNDACLKGPSYFLLFKYEWKPVALRKYNQLRFVNLKSHHLCTVM